MSGDYNHVYRYQKLILQITQERQNNGIRIYFLPQITVAIRNHRLWFGVGFEWLTGSVNIGIMHPEFIKAENERLQFIEREAKKQNLTPRQYQRWNP